MAEAPIPSEARGPIEKPVTLDALRQAAEAGYYFEVRNTIRFAVSPVSAAEGGNLLNIALGVQTDRLEAESKVLQGLADLSDDPNWQGIFGTRATDRRVQAEANRREIDTSNEAIEHLRGTSIPFYLAPQES
ncbi:MAG TPA: hypothetical protein VLF68_03035 [Candidatus Saccharimonadales bacterium]|nr:hypothetical protein [Candidatus Saccharimonadales bacterium]